MIGTFSSCFGENVICSRNFYSYLASSHMLYIHFISMHDGWDVTNQDVTVGTWGIK